MIFRRFQEFAGGVIGFKGVHYPKSVILHAVFFSLRYAVSYRSLDEIMAERGVPADRNFLADGRDVHQCTRQMNPSLLGRGSRRSNP